MTADDAGRAGEVLEYVAFSTDPDGGNPAGVVLDASAMDDSAMLAVAARLGHSETAFVTGPADDGTDDGTDDGPTGRAFVLRFFSPVDEVPFCGHATIATAVALAERIGPGPMQVHTRSGVVGVDTRVEGGALVATLTSVEPYVEEVDPDDVSEVLDCLGWREDELDPAMPSMVAYAGARHLVLGAATRDRLARLDYDVDRLAELMHGLDLITLQLVHREAADLFHVRDPFPVGGVVEDPATGAAALALGAYLREIGLVEAPARLRLHQGDDLGRPSRLVVELRAGDDRIRVTGAAVRLEPARGDHERSDGPG